MTYKEKETDNIILFFVIMSFLLGFLTAQIIYDDRPITEEEYYELQQTYSYD